VRKSNTKRATRAASNAKRAPVAKPASGGLIPLKAICAKLGLDPKRSRVKLRRVWRREEKPGVQFHEKNDRWDLSPAQAKEVTAILGGE
jgi:hypothetical protein